MKTTDTKAKAYIGIGANIGDAANSVLKAIDHLSEIGDLLAVSSLYKTEPWGITDQPCFVNAVAALAVGELTPFQLLQKLKDAENQMGRKPGLKWGPRIIDLDILTFGDFQIEEKSLTVPHPLLEHRAFVLVPLAEIDSSYTHLIGNVVESEVAGVTKLSAVKTRV